MILYQDTKNTDAWNNYAARDGTNLPYLYNYTESLQKYFVSYCLYNLEFILHALKSPGCLSTPTFHSILKCQSSGYQRAIPFVFTYINKTY